VSTKMHRTPPLLQGPIFTEWFKGGKTNIAYNCLDRHVKEGYGDQVWKGGCNSNNAIHRGPVCVPMAQQAIACSLLCTAQ